jgi:glutaredoxin
MMLGGGVMLVALVGLGLYAARPKPSVRAEPSFDSSAEVHGATAAQPPRVGESTPRRDVALPNRFAPAPVPTPEFRPNPTTQTADAGTPPAVAAKAPEPPSNAAIQAAFRATPIVMFSTTWCPVCKRARAFLDANGLSRDERDIDHDERARAELKRLTGKGSIPTFVVDGVLLKPGFSEESLTRAIVSSVEKRLNFRGISVRTGATQ